MSRRRRFAVLVVMLTALIAATSGAAGVEATSPGRAKPAAGSAADPACDESFPAGTADQLMHHQYAFPPHPTVTLPGPLTWREDPLHDSNWRFQFHSLRWLLALTQAWTATGDEAYLNRALKLAHSWIRLNPRQNPPSNMSWDGHAAAWRSITLTCIARIVPEDQRWLDSALVLHAETLADPAFYHQTVGNHSLNQNIGLLEIGCWLSRHDWMDLATKRINALIPGSIDDQGVTDEQSVGYELYNYQQYSLAAERFQACGETLAPEFDRVTLMPDFLAQATQPDGRYQLIGDTPDEAAAVIPGTPAEFAATQGASGPKPKREIAVYDAGYIFGRTGWGENRPFSDESAFSIRFGPPPQIHGHNDGGSLTLYGFGRRLLLDPGYQGYKANAFRTFFHSRSAHNVVVADGPTRLPHSSAKLVRSQLKPRSFDAQLAVSVYSGVTDRRRVTFSRELGYLIVDDQLSASRAATFRQLWHLAKDSRPTVHGDRTWTRDARGNVLIQQLVAGGATHVVKGATDPLQGWLPSGWGTHVPAPVVEQTAHGRSVRFLTLLVPFASGQPEVTVSHVTLTANGYSLTVRVHGHSQRVTATASGVTIRDLR